MNDTAMMIRIKNTGEVRGVSIEEGFALLNSGVAEPAHRATQEARREVAILRNEDVKAADHSHTAS